MANKINNKEFAYISIGLVVIAMMLFSFSSTGQFTGQVIDCGDFETYEGYSDFDSDGLPNFCEDLYRTNPEISDTDGDGRTDGEEIKSEKDPLSYD